MSIVDDVLEMIDEEIGAWSLSNVTEVKYDEVEKKVMVKFQFDDEHRQGGYHQFEGGVLRRIASQGWITTSVADHADSDEKTIWLKRADMVEIGEPRDGSIATRHGIEVRPF